MNKLKRTIKPLILVALRLRFRRSIKQHKPPYRLHLGCGYHHIDNWINIDFIDTPAVDAAWNLGQALPFDSESCRYIFHEHVLEHFELSRGLDLLSECYRVLRKGGVLRVAVPCLESVINTYHDGAWQDVDLPHMPKVRTGAEYINTMFRAWGHQWLYDQTELIRRLNEVGFSVTERQKIGQSSHAELQNVEYRADSDLIIEATK